MADDLTDAELRPRAAALARRRGAPPRASEASKAQGGEAALGPRNPPGRIRPRSAWAECTGHGNGGGVSNDG